MATAFGSVLLVLRTSQACQASVSFRKAHPKCIWRLFILSINLLKRNARRTILPDTLFLSVCFFRFTRTRAFMCCTLSTVSDESASFSLEFHNLNSHFLLNLQFFDKYIFFWIRIFTKNFAATG